MYVCVYVCVRVCMRVMCRKTLHGIRPKFSLHPISLRHPVRICACKNICTQVEIICARVHVQV